MSKKKEFEDDGRMIADMSMVESKGIAPSWFGDIGGLLQAGRRKPSTRRAMEPTGDQVSVPQEPLSPKETRSMILSAMLAGLSMSLIFVVGAFLFIMFCVHIWFA